MTTSRRVAFRISIAALLAVGLVGPAMAEENLVATYGEALLSGQYPNKFNWLSSMTYTEPSVV
jgi:hypothetical protein